MTVDALTHAAWSKVKTVRDGNALGQGFKQILRFTFVLGSHGADEDIEATKLPGIGNQRQGWLAAMIYVYIDTYTYYVLQYYLFPDVTYVCVLYV